MNLILFGFKKCGKTYFGLKIAQKMSMHFIDTDQVIEELFESRYHKKLCCKEIVLHHGLEFFRGLEKQVILSLANIDNTIIALGGGAILDTENLEHLKKVGTLVYLKLDKQTLQGRILSADIPAYIDLSDPIASFEKIYSQRIPMYESISAHAIDLQSLSEEQVIIELHNLIEEKRSSYGK